MIWTAALAAAMVLLAPAAAGASRDPASLAIAAWPARVAVVAPGRTTIHVDNPSDEPVAIDAAPSGYALDLHGRPQLRPAGLAGAWLTVRPAHVAVPARSTVALAVTVTRPRAAQPGDHALVVLVQTRVPSGRTVVARLRIGVVVVVRVPGTVVRRLTVGGVRAQRRGKRRVLFDVSVANRGNVDEWLGQRRLEITLVRRGRAVAQLHAEPRRLLARTPGIVEVHYIGQLRGALSAVVVLSAPRPGVAVLRRTFRVRL